MSAKTDDAINNIQNIIAKGMPHKDEMYAVQGYCDMLTKEIAELESDIETLHTDLNTIVPQQDKEIEQLKVERDAWKATAERMTEWMSEACRYCPIGYADDCPVDDYSECKGVVLTHFGAPEEDE